MREIYLLPLIALIINGGAGHFPQGFHVNYQQRGSCFINSKHGDELSYNMPYTKTSIVLGGTDFEG